MLAPKKEKKNLQCTLPTEKWTWSDLDKEQKKEVIIKKRTEKEIERKMGFTSEEELTSFFICALLLELLHNRSGQNVDWLHCHAAVSSFWMNLIVVSDCYLCSSFFAVPFGSTIPVNSSCALLTFIYFLFLSCAHDYSALWFCCRVFHFVLSFCVSVQND